MICTISIYHVRLELPNELLAINKIKNAISLLEVLLKVSLVSFPVILNFIKIAIIKRSRQRSWSLIINLSPSIEAIFIKLPNVGKLAIGVVKFSLSLHFSVLPVSLVDTAVRVLEFSVAISFVVAFFTVVRGAILVFFIYHFLNIGILLWINN